MHRKGIRTRGIARRRGEGPAALRGLAIELDVLGLKSVLVDSTDAQVRSRAWRSDGARHSGR